MHIINKHNCTVPQSSQSSIVVLIFFSPKSYLCSFFSYYFNVIAFSTLSTILIKGVSLNDNFFRTYRSNPNFLCSFFSHDPSPLILFITLCIYLHFFIPTHSYTSFYILFFLFVTNYYFNSFITKPFVGYELKTIIVNEEAIYGKWGRENIFSKPRLYGFSMAN